MPNVRGNVCPQEQEKDKEQEQEFNTLSLGNEIYEFPQRWQVPSLIRALKDWSAHILAQGKPFGVTNLERLLLHHASAGWSAEKLERGINLSMSKSTQTTIIDPDESDRPRAASGGRPKKDYTP